MENGAIILFDGVCNLCNGAVRFVIEHDKALKFKFASLQSTTGQAMLHALGMSLENFNTFVFIKDNKAYTKSTAALMVLKELGGPYRFMYVLILIPSFLRNLVYDFISKSRYQLWGKSDSCMVPTPALKERFL